ncbi:MAG: hypothetical protein JW795_06140 [Chitinivibrionales bacterium]|nr:hypothetical protein [Chitinivibrionales bacterium]
MNSTLRFFTLSALSVMILSFVSAQAQNIIVYDSIVQSGKSNASEISQLQNSTVGTTSAFIEQTGNLNTAAIRQTGTAKSNAIIQQIADTNFAYITQAQTSQCHDTIIQKGASGNATIYDSTVSSSASIYQEKGPRNKANIHQVGMARSTVMQKGSGNNSSVTLLPYADHTYRVTTIQDGDKNTIEIRSADAEVRQIGHDNDSKINANRSYDTKNVQRQGGYYNRASITQEQVVTNLSLTQTQSGNYDTATIVQTNTTYASITQTQSGDNNKAIVTQSNGNPTATQNQIGNYNTAIITQNGSGHSAEQEQIGSYYYSTINQKGEANTAKSRQRQ